MLIEITDKSGSARIINTDYVIGTVEDETDPGFLRVIMRGMNIDILVSREQFQKALRHQDDLERLGAAVHKLSDAVQRLTVQVPHTIRLHM